MLIPTKTKKILLLTSAFLLIVPSLLILVPNRSNAASLTNTYIRLSRMKAATNSTFRLVFKAASSQTAQVAVDFNGTDVGVAQWTNATPGGLVTTGAITTSTAQCAAEGFTALPGVTGATGSGSTVTTTGVTATTSGTTYCVDFTTAAAVKTPIAGEYHPTITQGTDSTNVALRIIAEDSIVVTATVPPSFTFVFNNTTTDGFGNLVTAGSSTTGKTITLTTNANTGWVVWAKSAQGATKGSLHSTAASKFITSSSALGSASHALGSSVEDYGLATTINTNANTGTLTLDPAYDGTSTKLGVLDTQNFRPIASATGTTTGDVLNVLERASITGATPAANDYTDTITFVGAGSF